MLANADSYLNTDDTGLFALPSQHERRLPPLCALAAIYIHKSCAPLLALLREAYLGKRGSSDRRPRGRLRVRRQPCLSLRVGGDNCGLFSCRCLLFALFSAITSGAGAALFGGMVSGTRDKGGTSGCGLGSDRCRGLMRCVEERRRLGREEVGGE